MNDAFDELLREGLQEQTPTLPPEVAEATETLLAALPDRPTRSHRPGLARLGGLAACLALLLVGLLPNLSPAYAEVAGQLPLLGPLVQVFTLRSHHYDDGSHWLLVDVPAIEDPRHPSSHEQLNAEVEELTGQVLAQFYRELEEAEQSYGSVQLSHEVVTNSPRWFTLHLTVHRTAADSETVHHFYHIDRSTGAFVRFGDLFGPEDYPALERELLAQMEARMAADPDAVYWSDAAAQSFPVVYLHPEQSFYFDGAGRLVLVYDSHQVAPGFMGCPSFSLPASLYHPLL